MPFLRGGSAANMLDDLKSRFGFGRRDFDEYDEEYDTYSDNFDDYSTYEDDMDRYGDVIERDADYRRPIRSQLVSMDDVRHATPRLTMGSTAESRMSSMRQSYHSDDYLSSGSVERDYANQIYAYGAGAPAGYGSMLPAADNARAGYPMGGSASRRLTVVAPTTYEDAEKVARGLKGGDAVVLNMRSTRPDLFKRILDFSFGAASVLDAKVDCVGDKVFALSVGAPLTDGERARLRGQGVIY